MYMHAHVPIFRLCIADDFEMSLVSSSCFSRPMCVCVDEFIGLLHTFRCCGHDLPVFLDKMIPYGLVTFPHL